MGNQNQTVKKFDYINDFTFIGEKERPAYGKFKLFRKQNFDGKELLAMKNFVSDNPKEILQIKKKITGLQNQDKDKEFENIVFLIQENSQNNHLCSDLYKLSVYIEYLEYSLADYVKFVQKCLQKDLLQVSENDYLTLIFQVLNGLLVLSQNNQEHGCINPWTILLSQKGYKICPHKLFSDSNGFDQMSQHSRYNCYLSPEYFAQLRTQNIKNFSQFKNDVFSLGMTILTMIKKINPSIFYNFDNNKFNFNFLNDHLNSLENDFSEQFIVLLRSMLNPISMKRLSIEDCISYINQHFNPEQLKYRYSQQMNLNISRNETILKIQDQDLYSRIKNSYQKHSEYSKILNDSLLNGSKSVSQKPSVLNTPIGTLQEIQEVSKQKFQQNALNQKEKLNFSHQINRNLDFGISQNISQENQFQLPDMSHNYKSKYPIVQNIRPQLQEQQSLQKQIKSEQTFQMKYLQSRINYKDEFYKKKLVNNRHADLGKSSPNLKRDNIVPDDLSDGDSEVRRNTSLSILKELKTLNSKIDTTFYQGQQGRYFPQPQNKQRSDSWLIKRYQF